MYICSFYIPMYLHSHPLMYYMYVDMWRLGAAATLPLWQKGRHGSHRRERKENLTKIIIYIYKITQYSESVQEDTREQWKTKATIELYTDKLKVTSTVINHEEDYNYSICTGNSDIQRHISMKKTKNYKDYKCYVHMNPIIDRASSSCMNKQ